MKPQIIIVKNRSGCMSGCLLIVIVSAAAVIFMAKCTQTLSEGVPQVVRTPPEIERLNADQKAAYEKSYKRGWEDGVIVGQAARRDGRKQDMEWAISMGKLHSQGHEGDKSAYAYGYQNGYKDGYQMQPK